MPPSLLRPCDWHRSQESRQETQEGWREQPVHTDSKPLIYSNDEDDILISVRSLSGHTPNHVYTKRLAGSVIYSVWCFPNEHTVGTVFSSVFPIVTHIFRLCVYGHFKSINSSWTNWWYQWLSLSLYIWVCLFSPFLYITHYYPH